MATIYADDITFTRAVSFDPVDATAGNAMVPTKRYVSQLITEAHLTGGAATCTVALTGEPTAMIPRACYVVTDEATTSGDVATTGLAAEVGIVSGDADFLMTSVSVFGAAGRKQTATVGVGLGCYRASDALCVKFTATGAGSEDVGDIDNLSLRVVILYAPVSAEA